MEETKKRKLQLSTDFYQLSVGNVYIEEGLDDTTAVFDLFIRRNPFSGGYTVFAGLENVIDYITQLRFEEEDIQMLKENHPELTDKFIDCLRNFKFTGELHAVREGTIIFPFEPMIRVKAPLIQAQIIETALLAIVNHESLIATKASRVCHAAQENSVLEFGLRRAHGTESGLHGARSAIIGGCAGTSNVETEYRYGLISKGTISHAYVMNFDDEYEAFKCYARHNPQNITLLVDTYDTLKSGVPKAIQVFSELRDKGELNGIYGIRLDSGDLAYLSAKSREMLDAAGLNDALITASSDLDEYLISELRAQGARIDLWGVGTKMITAYDCPALGAVYKLSQTEKDGIVKPKMKLSDDPFKITNPGCKKIIRMIDRTTNKATADLIMMEDEEIDFSQPLKIYHPFFSYKQRVVRDYYCDELLVCIFRDGELVYDSPGLNEIKEYHKQQKSLFWNDILRFVNPNEYHVDLSDKLYDIKKEFLHSHNYE